MHISSYAYEIMLKYCRYSSCAWWPYEYGSASGVSTSACQSVSTSCPSQSQYYTGSTTYTATGYWYVIEIRKSTNSGMNALIHLASHSITSVH